VTTASAVAIPTAADWRMSTRTMPTVTGTAGRSVLWQCWRLKTRQLENLIIFIFQALGISPGPFFAEIFLV